MSMTILRPTASMAFNTVTRRKPASFGPQRSLPGLGSRGCGPAGVTRSTASCSSSFFLSPLPQQQRYFFGFSDASRSAKKSKAATAPSYGTKSSKNKQRASSGSSALKTTGPPPPAQPPSPAPIYNHQPPPHAGEQQSNPIAMMFAGMFGTLVIIMVMQRLWPRKITLVHKDRDGYAVDPATGRRL
ncbi:unnamed protein product [Amoebophrya sp. A25]|nr:unnamed protein product [Amoebophrya sp. A25]|eukprot:GSA25T00014215001.1